MMKLERNLAGNWSLSGICGAGDIRRVCGEGKSGEKWQTHLKTGAIAQTAPGGLGAAALYIYAFVPINFFA